MFWTIVAALAAYELMKLVAKVILVSIAARMP